MIYSSKTLVSGRQRIKGLVPKNGTCQERHLSLSLSLSLSQNIVSAKTLVS